MDQATREHTYLHLAIEALAATQACDTCRNDTVLAFVEGVRQFLGPNSVVIHVGILSRVRTLLGKKASVVV